MNVRLHATVAAVLAATLAISIPVAAQTTNRAAQAEPSKVVHYSDVDVSTPAGARALYGRLQNAAWRVCQLLVPAHNGPSAIENAKCRRTLVDAAVDEVNQPELSAVAHRRNSDDLTARR
jgi:UrcA family protein